MSRPKPTGVEVSFDADDILVSKTDARGVITYANQPFIQVAGYTESELLGRPHSVVRHPNMPRAVFHLLWEEIQSGREIFAYVINLAKNGDHYWVFAHVTPDIDPVTGGIVGYHSSRRRASKTAINEIESLYAQIREVEAKFASPREACAAGRKFIAEVLAAEGITYEQFVFRLFQLGTAVAA